MPNADSQTLPTRICEEGNNGFMIAPLNPDNTYGDVTKIEGIISLDLSLNLTTTSVAADDNPDYILKQSEARYEGSVTFAGLTKEGYEALYSNITDSNGAIVFGRKNALKKVGFSFFTTELSTESESTNKTTFNNAYFSLPNVSTTTRTEGDNTIRTLSVPVVCRAYVYERSDGKKDKSVVNFLNSERNKDIWELVRDTIYVPDKKYSL